MQCALSGEQWDQPSGSLRLTVQYGTGASAFAWVCAFCDRLPPAPAVGEMPFHASPLLHLLSSAACCGCHPLMGEAGGGEKEDGAKEEDEDEALDDSKDLKEEVTFIDT